MKPELKDKILRVTQNGKFGAILRCALNVERDAAGQIVSRRAFHSGGRHMNKPEILARGYVQLKLPGKLRFARGLTRAGKRAVKETKNRLQPTDSTKKEMT